VIDDLSLFRAVGAETVVQRQKPLPLRLGEASSFVEESSILRTLQLPSSELWVLCVPLAVAFPLKSSLAFEVLRVLSPLSYPNAFLGVATITADQTALRGEGFSTTMLASAHPTPPPTLQM
jgi:hypothetical protein